MPSKTYTPWPFTIIDISIRALGDLKIICHSLSYTVNKELIATKENKASLSLQNKMKEEKKGPLFVCVCGEGGGGGRVIPLLPLGLLDPEQGSIMLVRNFFSGK